MDAVEGRITWEEFATFMRGLETIIERGKCPKCGSGTFRVAGYGPHVDVRFPWRRGWTVIYAVCTGCETRVVARDGHTAGRWYDKWRLWTGPVRTDDVSVHEWPSDESGGQGFHG
jgi:hypothetical protein